jgi:DNA-binding NarL/FixJ family response regulator
MTPFELSLLADQYLKSIPRDPEMPHYTEDGFRCKLRQAHKRERTTVLPRRPESQLYLIRKEWIYILAHSKLTCRQIEVVRLRLSGKTFEEIGSMSGCSKQAVLNVLQQASKKIRATQDRYPYEGLAEIYREETRRGVSPSRKGKLLK